MSSSSGSSCSSPSPLPTSPIASVHYSLQNTRTEDSNVFQSIFKSRKSWKALKGGEVVWPPELEAALIEALENYQPDDSRETRLLGRFPLRNKFISEWIFRKTGKRRTAKQVGSRLQQLRDTCGGKRILSLISPFRHPHRSTSLSPEFYPRSESESGSESSSSTSAPTTPIGAHATLQSLLYRGVESREKMPNNIVYIDLLRPGSSVNDNDTFWTSPSQVAEERSLVERGYKIIRSGNYPRHLRDIDPTIAFLSHLVSNARSYFTVHLGDSLIFSESTTLELVDPDGPSTSNVDGILYKTLLVPGFWETIAQSPDASQYTIIQRVVEDPCLSPSPSTIFSAVYKFLYQTSTPTLENFAISHTLTPEPLVQNDEFCLDSLITMEDDAFPDKMDFVKPPDFYYIDFAMGSEWSSEWSEQCSPDHSVFSSPGQYPQLVNGVPDEDVQLLPASFFDINSPNYL